MKPPTVEEIQAYADARGYVGFDAEAFFDHHQERGWKVAAGKTTVPMSDWKAAVRTWRRNDVKWGRVKLPLPPAAPKVEKPWTPRMEELFKKVDARTATDEEVVEFLRLKEDR